MASKVEEEQAQSVADTANATLVIGNSYTYKGVRFVLNTPRPVSLDMAKELEALTLGSTDSRSRKQIAQHRFEIEWPDGYSDASDEDEQDEASSGAKRPAKRVVGRKPSRATR